MISEPARALTRSAITLARTAQVFGEEALWRQDERYSIHGMTLTFVSVQQAQPHLVLDLINSDPIFAPRFHCYCAWRRIGNSVHSWHASLQRVRWLLEYAAERGVFPSFQSLVFAARPLAMPWEHHHHDLAALDGEAMSSALTVVQVALPEHWVRMQRGALYFQRVWRGTKARLHMNAGRHLAIRMRQPLSSALRRMELHGLEHETTTLATAREVELRHSGATQALAGHITQRMDEMAQQLESLTRSMQRLAAGVQPADVGGLATVTAVPVAQLRTVGLLPLGEPAGGTAAPSAGGKQVSGVPVQDILQSHGGAMRAAMMSAALAKREFNDLDIDGGGTIELEEFVALARELGADATEAEVLGRSLMLQADKDGDGQVDREEFDVFKAQLLRSQWQDDWRNWQRERLLNPPMPPEPPMNMDDKARRASTLRERRAIIRRMEAQANNPPSFRNFGETKKVPAMLAPDPPPPRSQQQPPPQPQKPQQPQLPPLQQQQLPQPQKPQQPQLPPLQQQQSPQPQKPQQPPQALLPQPPQWQQPQQLPQLTSQSAQWARQPQPIYSQPASPFTSRAVATTTLYNPLFTGGIPSPNGLAYTNGSSSAAARLLSSPDYGNGVDNGALGNGRNGAERPPSDVSSTAAERVTLLQAQPSFSRGVPPATAGGNADTASWGQPALR